MGKCVECGKSLGFLSLKNKCDECALAEQKTDKDRKEQERKKALRAAAGNQPHHGSILLLNEAERQLARMNSSDYTHTTHVDEENGTYDYDCSGFVGYALSRADPCAFSVLLHKGFNVRLHKGFNVRLHKRPDTGNFYYHLLHRARPRQWRLDEGLNPARTPSRGYHCLAETGLFRCE